MNNFETRSYYANLHGQVLNWLPMDTKELFEHNLKRYRSTLEKYNWIDRDITYNFNAHGFRCKEFTDNPSIMFLGCSRTVGIGLPLESTWAHIVSENLNLQNVNLGLGGGSTDSSFRMCLSYIDKIKPKVICYLQPSEDRYELLHSNFDAIGVWARGIWDLDGGDRFQKKLFKYWSSIESNSILNAEKNNLAIKQLCHERKIKLCSFTSNNLSKCSKDIKDIEYVDNEKIFLCTARDLAHNGERTNRAFADIVIKTINSI